MGQLCFCHFQHNVSIIAGAEAKAVLDSFACICDDRKIDAVLHADTGSPVSELVEESKFHD